MLTCRSVGNSWDFGSTSGPAKMAIKEQAGNDGALTPRQQAVKNALSYRTGCSLPRGQLRQRMLAAPALQIQPNRSAVHAACPFQGPPLASVRSSFFFCICARRVRACKEFPEPSRAQKHDALENQATCLKSSRGNKDTFTRAPLALYFVARRTFPES